MSDYRDVINEIVNFLSMNGCVFYHESHTRHNINFFLYIYTYEYLFIFMHINIPMMTS